MKDVSHSSSNTAKCTKKEKSITSITSKTKESRVKECNNKGNNRGISRSRNLG